MCIDSESNLPLYISPRHQNGRSSIDLLDAVKGKLYMFLSLRLQDSLNVEVSYKILLQLNILCLTGTRLPFNITSVKIPSMMISNSKIYNISLIMIVRQVDKH